MSSVHVSTSRTNSDQTLDRLSQAVRGYFLANPSHAAIFVPILRGEALENYDFDNLHSISYSKYARELGDIKSFIEHNFPSPTVSPLDKTCGHCKACMVEKSNIELHGRLVAALSATRDMDTIINLRFILAVIIIHCLAHTFAVGNPMPVRIDDYPFYKCNYLFLARDIAEPGFFAEEGIFGGIIGIVFKDQENGMPPRFLEADFTKIAYLFLLDRTGAAYRLNTGELREQLKSHRFGRFTNTRHIELPRKIIERTCAAFNGDHLPIKRVGAGRAPDWLEAIIEHGDLEYTDDRFHHECVHFMN
ncbi:unnamed protein product [Somion occarium]|uniref:Uncharacterized protein n=1 Tax=Somion occarium TaxID=3059160 RepID=A0ABP1CTE2_9APHY